MRMDALDRCGIEESLFICTTAAGTWEFVTVRGRGCALLLDGERVTSGDASPASVDRVLSAFMRVARSGGTAGAVFRAVPPPAETDGTPEPLRMWDR